MRKTFALMLLAAAAAGGLGLPPLGVSAQDAPQTCPITEPGEPGEPGEGTGEGTGEYVGLWSLTSLDGEAPITAFRVRLFTEGSARVWLGDSDQPIEANCGTNCCGHLVLSPDEEGAFDPIVAEFEVVESTLTLFAPNGDWVFERLEFETETAD